MAIIVLIVLILLNAFFAASEIALISLNDNRIRAMAEDGHKKAKLLEGLLREPSRFLATIQIGITLAGFLASAFAAESFADDLAAFAANQGVPVPQKLLHTIALVVITLVLSYFTLVFGELVPKRLAMKKAEPIAMLAVRPLVFLSTVTYPVVRLLTGSTNLIVRLFGVDPNADDEEVTEEEIRMMVDVGEERGAIDKTEKMMINNIFDFDNKTVGEIMTHRLYVVGIPLGATLKDVVATISSEKYTRYPVYREHMDDIVGILHVKDLTMYVMDCDEEAFDLTKLLRKPYHVPLQRPIDEVFREFQKNKVHMAIVIDEYGGTAGIVTAEDLLEEIVGNIFDEYDEDVRDIVKMDDQSLLVSGIVDLDEIERLLDIGLPVDRYDTVSGFVIGQLGRFPEAGDQAEIVWEGYTFRAEGPIDKRIAKVRIVPPGSGEAGTAGKMEDAAAPAE
ncbi:MAG: HlyC/CorC family transporter [Thermobacillus sp.]|uniref:hemolysin family protein n=1 Tax=Thermobacillus sp. TaxID=2108467 RepID=UPI000E3A1952|nr:hemolysin family protein [Thermobacillus sp.]REK59527.1 MAG: HlyC/CorC family transporter [Thermobacillus sp.]